MADFSKQCCELHDPQMVHDFDILEIAESMENGFYTSVICEGFGFAAIAKDETGQILIGMPTYGDRISGEPGTTIQVEWKAYSDVIK